MLIENKFQLVNSNLFLSVIDQSKKYDDNYPFFSFDTVEELLMLSSLPTIISLVIFSIISFLLALKLRKISDISMLFIGLTQLMIFSLLQFKFNSFLVNDYITTLSLISLSLLSSFVGLNYFNIVSLRKIKYFDTMKKINVLK